MAILKTKIFTIIFGIQCLVLVLQITNVSSIPQYSNQPQIRPSRRRPESQLSYGNDIYGAARLQKRPSRRRGKSSPTAHPNSYYSRLLSNTINPSRADKDNEERDKTLHHHHHGGHDGLFGGSNSNRNGLHSIHNFHHNNGNRRRQTNPCYRRRRNYYRSNNNNREQEGRFLWDLNLYNVHSHHHPHHSALAQYDDCGDSGGSGLYSDNGPIRRPTPQNYLELLANSGFGIRPSGGGSRPYRPSGGSLGGGGSSGGGGGGGGGDSDNDIGDSDVYDPVYDDRDRPVYESQLDANAGPVLSPGQIVGGVAHTVNGIIQTLAGNTQPGRYGTRYSRYTY